MDIFERYFEGELKTGFWVNFISNVVYTISLGTIQSIFLLLLDSFHTVKSSISPQERKSTYNYLAKSPTPKKWMSHTFAN